MVRISAISSALLLTLSFPPFNLTPVVFVALIPLLVALPDRNARQAWGAGYLFGLVFSLGQLHWLAGLTQKWTGSFGLALVPWLLASFAMACYFGLFGYLANRCIAQSRLWMVPLIWVGIEVFRTYIPVLAFPWALVATPLWKAPALIQTASLGTIYIVSFWVVAVNLTLAVCWKNRAFPKEAQVLTATAFALPILSLALYLVPRSQKTAPVTLGQIGIDLAFETPERIAAIVPRRVRSFQSSARADGSRLLVLPEGIVTGTDQNSFFPFPLDPAVPTLFGAQRQNGAHAAYQSAVGFDGNWSYADKTRLVIFGEFVPGRDFLPFLNAFNLPGGDLSAGTSGVTAMTLRGLRVGPLLCFEGLFPDLAFRQALNGSELIPVISDDDWFMNSSAPEQLKAGSIWRAVETGVPVVRVGSLGYSLAVDSKGKVLADLPLGKAVAQTVQMPISRANRWFWLLPLFPALGVLSCLLTLITLRTKRNKQVTN
jgi:apolipoprotein N-acyltransferase